MDEIGRLQAEQDGVIARRQALACGLSPTAINRLVRRRAWSALHPGVYVDHTGPPTWLQRAWAAVLFSWPAALSHESALRAADGPGRRDRDDSVIHVAVDRSRHLTEPEGVRLHRMARLPDRVLWNLSPPRVRYDEAVLDLAAAAEDDLAAIAQLADALRSRRTTVPRLAEALAGRTRIARREWLGELLTDLAEGTCSVLEHGYLVRVERPHGLPPGRRQVRESGPFGTVFRDVDYPESGVLVELDGRLFHESTAARDRDLDRDLHATVSDRQTVRLGYGQVFARPCGTAAAIATLLQRRGWHGSMTRCPECGDSVQAA